MSKLSGWTASQSHERGWVIVSRAIVPGVIVLGVLVLGGQCVPREIVTGSVDQAQKYFFFDVLSVSEIHLCKYWFYLLSV